MNKTSRPKGREDNIVVQRLDDELLVYDTSANRAFCLNQTSAIVWQACDGQRTLAGITDEVGRQLEAHVEDDVVFLALDQLSREGLIDGESYLPEKFDGMNRRDVIKKIGLSTVLAVPVIASMVAPTAAQSASACVVEIGGCFCGSGGSTPAGTFCIPSGTFAMNCADPNCRCLSQGFLAADDCVP